MEIVARGIRLSLRHAPCAHICRYCLISETRKRSMLPFTRFEQLVHRFFDWREASGRDLDIRFFVGPSFDYDLKTLEGVGRLRARRGAMFSTLNLGGLRLRSGEALDAWLDERQAAGITDFHTSLAGYGEIHDRWNGRAGDFDYQTLILRRGGERGMGRVERLFLTQNTLPLFDRLLDILDAIPGAIRDRYGCLLFYAGLANRYEDERITEEIRDNLPARLKGIRLWRQQNWRSEREWIPIIQETTEPRKIVMKLDVNEANIEHLERLSCEEIFAECEHFYRDDYRRLPSLDTLCARYGDTSNRKIYMLSRDLEQKWMEMHQRETGIRVPAD
jgi:hypothetical protein